MDKNYWKSCIGKFPKDKKLELLEYEIVMFRETIKNLKINRQNKFQTNLLIESLALHSRILIGFFYKNEEQLKMQFKEDDICADDFIENWGQIRPKLTDYIYFVKNKADKQLAHLSSWRIKLVDDNKNGWNFQKIEEDIEKNIILFKHELK